MFLKRFVRAKILKRARFPKIVRKQILLRKKVAEFVIVIYLNGGEEFLTQPRGCLPFVRISRLGRALNNGNAFSKISEPTERNGAYHLQFDFP